MLGPVMVLAVSLIRDENEQRLLKSQIFLPLTSAIQSALKLRLSISFGKLYTLFLGT